MVCDGSARAIVTMMQGGELEEGTWYRVSASSVTRHASHVTHITHHTSHVTLQLHNVTATATGDARVRCVLY